MTLDLPELLRASETTTGDRAADEIERLRADRDQGAKDYCALRDREDALTVRVAELEAALRLAQDAMTAIKFSIDPNDITDDLTAVFDLGNRAVNAALNPK